MKRNYGVLKFVAFLFLIFFILFFLVKFYANSQVVEVKKLNATLNVSDYVGINLDVDKLHFGTVIPGGHANRALNVNSKESGYVFVTSSGAYDWLFVSNQGLKVLSEFPLKLEFEARPQKEVFENDFEEEVFVYVLKKDAQWVLFFHEGKILKTFFKEEKTPSVMLDIKNPLNDSENQNIMDFADLNESNSVEIFN